jgi:hypothetical protein
MTLVFGLRRHTALSRACKARSVVMRDCMDHPTTRLENRSMTTDRYDHPSWVLIYVMSVTQTVSGASIARQAIAKQSAEGDLKLPIQRVVGDDRRLATISTRAAFVANLRCDDG